MKNKTIVLAALCVPMFAFTGKYLNEKSENESAVKEMVFDSYINGAFNELDYESMANGFHEDFAIFSADGESLSRYEIEDWVSGVKKRKLKPEFDASKNKWEHNFAMVDVTGNSAMVKVELTRKGKHVYTDYLSLIKFESGWKIVGKVYTQHK